MSEQESAIACAGPVIEEGSDVQPIESDDTSEAIKNLETTLDISAPKPTAEQVDLGPVASIHPKGNVNAETAPEVSVDAPAEALSVAIQPSSSTAPEVNVPSESHSVGTGSDMLISPSEAPTKTHSHGSDEDLQETMDMETPNDATNVERTAEDLKTSSLAGASVDIVAEAQMLVDPILTVSGAESTTPLISNTACDAPVDASKADPEPSLEKSLQDITLPEADVPAAQPTTNTPAVDGNHTPVGDGRQLNVSDALSYLDAVKQQFHDKPDVYNLFLDIMKDFKSQLIDTPGVIERVSSLFSGHPNLIQGFNTFLPVGYRIECSVDVNDANLITVTTPTGTTTQTTGGTTIVPGSYILGSRPPLAPTAGPSVVPAAVASPGLLDPTIQADGIPYTPEQISPAIAYVTKIKARFADHTDLYQEFLDILNLYKKGSPVDESILATRIAKLFQGAPDLLSDFQVFMPQGILPNPEMLGALEPLSEKVEKAEKNKKKVDAIAVPMVSGTGAQKRKRRPAEREREKEKPREIVAKPGPKAKKPKHQQNVIQHEATYPQYRGATPPPHRGHVHNQPQPPPVQTHAAPDDNHFFERVKRLLDNREQYNEFLKLLNLFTQEFIDMRTLVEQSYSYLRDGELMSQFKDILGWDSKWENDRHLSTSFGDGYGRGAGTLDRPNRIDMNIRNGPSYRRLPANELNVTCTGRDDMCRGVLNDEWVSHPTWASEDAGFVAHKKNAYEEALHRSEEERHEYDFHIEAIMRTIAMLEPISNKINQMSQDERSSFKLKANFGGSSKSIHQRIIKKIYGREPGLEVIQTMHDCPSIAIPVVLSRLKQKEEEWKRAQREWNKVWREVDARNYQKSLDHQGITFKANDKKTITTKTFVNQIEAAREEQMAKRASLIDPLFARTRPRHQMELVVEDMSVLQDLLKLTFSFLDRAQQQIGFTDRRKVESFLRSFVPTFFMLDAPSFDAVFLVRKDTLEGEVNISDDFMSPLDDSEDLSSSGGNSRSGRSGRRAGGGDLRKRLLKSSAQEKSSLRRTRTGPPSNPGSRPASPALTETMAIDDPQVQASPPPATDMPHESRDSLNLPTAQASAPSSPISPRELKPTRRGTFYANATLYSVLRLLELLHARLHSCKQLAAKLASESSGSYMSNPTASDLGLVDAAPPDNGLVGIYGRRNPAAHFYEYLLDSCERLFDNEIDQQTFEEIARFMFGTKAYVVFTIDKVIGALVKQVQSTLADSRCLELLENLRRERQLPSPNHEDQLNYRGSAQHIVGLEENLFRIEWLPDSKTMTFQLLAKDDPNPDDNEVITGRWQAYIESFVSDAPTSSLRTTVTKLPFLKRNLKECPATPPSTEFHGRSNLEIKVCVRTYRIFYVSHTEDVLWRYLGSEERDDKVKRISSRAIREKRWLAQLDNDGTLPRSRR